MNQPPEHWVLIYKSDSKYKIDLVKALLSDNSITSEEINSHDHMFDALNVMREIGLYIHQSDMDLAHVIIKSANVE
ncbi:MAG: hypothetical protein HN542_09145 [Flavobacteriales bacterium]|jgi:hypothetical protein|nr:hypothetical protein [Flavobacteriales bacterium]NCG30274.1 hypothetical protein [Bacteroidota bacterium]MBT3963845.1 hypothetical protein [Flavobacteriales bacterium]MBT4704947.1 hypothetical protein [Flavobacteriales bacterium]MBT4929722.1 hypothetical protein [Flavobacteriales bacterium]